MDCLQYPFSPPGPDGGGGGGSRNSPSDPTNLFKVMMFANIKGGCCLSVCHCVYICVWFELEVRLVLPYSHRLSLPLLQRSKQWCFTHNVKQVCVNNLKQRARLKTYKLPGEATNASRGAGLRMCFWWSLRSLYSLTCLLVVIAGHSGLRLHGPCLCGSFWELINLSFFIL